MKFRLKAQSFLDLVIHLVIITGLGLLILVIFFNVILPISTRHSNRVTVPDLQGMTMEEVIEALEEENLRYEVLVDSAYEEEAEPQTVLLQDPNPNHEVKRDRKVYLTLNSVIPPSVVMPNLTSGSSFRNAQLVLTSLGLRIGQITYRPDMAVGTVLEQRFDGQEVAEGTPIPMGSEIDLVLAESYGRRNFGMPLLKGLSRNKAEFTIKGNQLQIGEVTVLPDTAGTPGIVVDQFPDPGNGVKIGDRVDFTVFDGIAVEPDPILDSLNQSLLEQQQ